MSELSIKLNWRRSEPVLVPTKYTNAHSIIYNEKYKVVVDAAPDWGGNANNTNTEQALGGSFKLPHDDISSTFSKS